MESNISVVQEQDSDRRDSVTMADFTRERFSRPTLFEAAKKTLPLLALSSVGSTRDSVAKNKSQLKEKLCRGSTRGSLFGRAHFFAGVACDSPGEETGHTRKAVHRRWRNIAESQVSLPSKATTTSFRLSQLRKILQIERQAKVNLRCLCCYCGYLCQVKRMILFLSNSGL